VHYVEEEKTEKRSDRRVR